MIKAANTLLAHWLSRLPRQKLLEVICAERVSARTFCGKDFQALLSKLRVGGRAAGTKRYQHPEGEDTLSKKSGWRIGWFDDAFPELLRQIPDPPLLLYGMGVVAHLRIPAVAIVGARRCTTVGRHMAGELGAAMATAGVTVVSGLAYGVDAAAHQGALAHGGVTVAVLGGGLDRPYPARHGPLLRDIAAQRGVVLSEYPPQISPRPHHFLERNRLISGLSSGTVVVEAGARSGSLSTARFALEQGREVMAVPGAASSQVSRGCHRLIQEGAALVTCARDVFEVVGLTNALQTAAATEAPSDSSGVQQSVLDSAVARQVVAQLRGYPKSVDELVMELQLSSQVLAAVLTELELAGIVERGPVGYIATS